MEDLKIEFRLYQGSTFTRDFYIEDNNKDKIDLSSFSFRAEIRSRIDNTYIGKFSFIPIDKHFINMFITATDSALLLDGKHKFDVEMFTLNDGFVEKIMIGTIEILQEVTV